MTPTDLSSQRLLIVGSADSSQLGAMFWRAAAQCGIAARIVDIRANLTPTFANRILFHALGRRHPGEGALNRQLMRDADEFKPTVVLVTGLMPVRATTLERLRGAGIGTVNFMTDDPFNPIHRNPTAIASIPAFDVHISVKPTVDADLRAAGARRVTRSWFAYDPAVHFREAAPLADASKWSADVSFIGGADADRAALLGPVRAWAEQDGSSLAVFGGFWDRYPEYGRSYRGLALGSCYRYALTGADVLLCPVRRANRDGHCMRTFEGPAAGAFMLLERTPDHLELFEDERHAAFFETPDELRDKARFYLKRPDDRRRMAEAAHALITAGGHTYADRLVEILRVAATN